MTSPDTVYNKDRQNGTHNRPPNCRYPEKKVPTNSALDI